MRFARPSHSASLFGNIGAPLDVDGENERELDASERRQNEEEDEEWALSSTHRDASQPEKGQYFAVQRSDSFDCDFASMRPHGEIARTSLKESEGSDSEKTATAC